MSARPVITIIEPDAQFSALIRTYLRILVPQADLLFFGRSRDALASLKAFPPGLVISELGEAHGLLATHPRGARKFNVLVLTEDASERAFQSAKAAGADDVCGKPLDEILLKSKIETLLFGLYASPFSFFGVDGGLSRISMCFSSQVFQLSEESVEFASQVYIKPGAGISLELGGKIVRVRIEKCRINPNRVDSHFVRGAFASDLTVEERAAIRRAVLSVRMLQATP